MTISEGIRSQIEAQSRIETEPRFTLQNSICLSVSFRKIGTTRKAKKEQIDFNANKEYMEAQAKILQSSTLETITTRDGQITSWIKARVLPLNRLFRAGIYLLPPDLVPEVDAKIEAYKAERAAYVQQFAEEYFGIKEAMRDRLGVHFDESHYLGTEEQVVSKFGFDVSYIAFDVPITLRGVSESMFRREEERVRQQMAATQKDIEDTLAYGALELLDWLRDVLTEGEDGKKKRLVDSKLELMQQFFSLLDARNVTGNSTLAQAAEQGRLLMNMANGTRESYTAMRQNSVYAGIVTDKVAEIKDIIKPLVVEARGRKFRYDPEDDE